MSNSVCIKKESIYINGKATIILCASVFYFRIPGGMWRDRLKKTRSAGYNCIDVYFPWNYHETKEGMWDFQGDKDVENFLSIAEEEGLWVIARPGPYICSEWDGGGLPSYLFVNKDMKIRDNDPKYLTYVEKWYDHILPMLKKHQITENGSIIAVQLENELDFYDCKDVSGYMNFLKKTAIDHEIVVPLIACSGQGDIVKAGGTIKGINPAINLYGAFDDLHFENKVMQYHNLLQKYDTPVIVTETEKTHFVLRRLLSCGAKFMGPYNMVGGTNFGFNNAVNNWGNPIAFLTTDYDFNGMISPSGELKKEFFEARLFSSFLNIFGERIAKAQPIKNEKFKVTGDIVLSEGGLHIIELSGGGNIIAAPNFSETASSIYIESNGETIPKYSKMLVSSHRCPFLLTDVLMESCNIKFKIVYSTSELQRVVENNNSVEMVLYTDYEGEISLNFDENFEASFENIQLLKKDNNLTLWFNNKNIGTAQVKFQSGKLLKLFTMGRDSASRISEIDDDSIIKFEEKYTNTDLNVISVDQLIDWKYTCENQYPTQLLNDKIISKKCNFLEQEGIYRGFGWYKTVLPVLEGESVKGFLVHEASDIVTLYSNGIYQDTVIPGGGFAYIEATATEGSESLDLTVRTEIWGHSNFDDSRLPAMRIKSLKGIGNITAVTHKEDISKNWCFYESEENKLLEEIDFNLCPIISIGGWTSTKQPIKGYYKKTFPISSNANSFVLEFEGIQSKSQVYINGKSVGTVNNFNPFVNISEFITKGIENEIIIYVDKRHWEEFIGKVIIFQGNTPDSFYIAGMNETELWNHAQRYKEVNEVNFPIELESGSTGWLLGIFKNTLAVNKSFICKCEGENVKLSILFNGHLVGRLWLKSNKRPVMVGGNDEIVYLPKCWFNNNDNKISIFVEAIAKGELSKIHSFTLTAIG